MSLGDNKFHDAMVELFVFEHGIYNMVDKTGCTIGQLILKDDQGVTEVDLVWVPKHMRGQSIGEQMLGHLVNCADRTGLDLMLSVMPSDPVYIESLVSWYEKQGFAITEELCSGDDLVMYRHAAPQLELEPG